MIRKGLRPLLYLPAVALTSAFVVPQGGRTHNGFVLPFRTTAAAAAAAAGGRGRQSSITGDDILRAPKFPDSWPFTPKDFQRMDEGSDGVFYDHPRLVYHIDEHAIKALTRYYYEVFSAWGRREAAPPDVLDLCSSWVSHFPEDSTLLGKRVGLGMNEYELSQNKQLDSYVVKDLNVDPALPFSDASFDIITCVVSVDYLNRPREVFEEIQRVLRPGGVAIMSISNRCFPTKAISLWLDTNDLEHIFIVGCYFHYTPGFLPPESKDLRPRAAVGDPMYIVQAQKEGGERS